MDLGFCVDNNNDVLIDLCARKEILTNTDLPTHVRPQCTIFYVDITDSEGEYPGIENKDLSDRFLTALILSLIVGLANIGLALFGFLLFRTPGDF